MREFQDVRLAYGESDEYSFVFSPGCKLYGARRERVAGCVTCRHAAMAQLRLPAAFDCSLPRVPPKCPRRPPCF